MKLVMTSSPALKTRSNSAFRLIYHLVLVTKFRKQSLSSQLLEDMRRIVNQLLGKWECELIEFGGESDHVHILLEAHPSVELAKLVNNIKTVTSRKLRLQYKEHLSQFYWSEKPLFWSGSYAVISVGAGANLEKLIRYVQSQEHPE
jgi:putative transposase